MKSPTYISDATFSFIWKGAIAAVAHAFALCFPEISWGARRGNRSRPGGSMDGAVFSDLPLRVAPHVRRSEASDVESPRCINCEVQEVSSLQREIMEIMPELTGVWFYRGEVRGKVNLDRMPKNGWFEMYAEKTG